ncbi:MAG: hypothetical protein ABI443_08195 [Chthoniobacterales bacterium]
MRYLLLLPCIAAFVFFAGCETTQQESEARAAMNAAIKTETPGNYFIGRRFHKVDYKMWGWVRKPGQLWNQAQLVMLNEQKKLAPDREKGKIGEDNNYEYKLDGYFSGDLVYEPASNHMYPEFVLTGYELRSVSPAPIFHERREATPEVRLLTPPM